MSAREGIDDVSRWFGIRWEHRNVARLTIRPELINAGGLLSGVATYALVDYVMGSTLWRETTDDEAIATLHIALNYIQTAREGDVICETTLDRRNRHAATMRSQARYADGRLMANSIGSYAIFAQRG